MLITSSVETKWAPATAVDPPALAPEALALPCNGSITIICWEDGVVECAEGEGWEEEEGRPAALEDGGIVPIGYDKGCGYPIRRFITIVR